MKKTSGINVSLSRSVQISQPAHFAVILIFSFPFFLFFFGSNCTYNFSYQFKVLLAQDKKHNTIFPFSKVKNYVRDVYC